MDILTTITTQRVLDVAASKSLCSASQLQARIAQRYPAPPLCLSGVLGSLPGMAVAAEFKRASPSKGDIVPPGTAIDSYASAYTLGGAHILSVLTEPTWFKGSLEDMEAARATSERAAAGAGSPRPLILRKDFVVDEYQLLEARAYGADTALLIVASLPTVQVLQPLVLAARALGMEPLVEVNNVEELGVALAAGARVVGINNRNLRTFEVDLGTTARIVAHAAGLGRGGSSSSSAPLAILSLSGIKSGADVQGLVAECAQAPGGLAAMRGFLIGEALMRCASPLALVQELCAAGSSPALAALASAPAAGEPAQPGAPPPPSRLPPQPLQLGAKICGVRDSAAAVHAARAGARFIGMILVPGSPRTVDSQGGAAITQALAAFREQDPGALLAQCAGLPGLLAAGGSAAAAAAAAPTLDAARLRAAGGLLQAAATRARPLCVGVFRDATPAAVLQACQALGLDVAQLHGRERAGDFAGFPLPLIKVLHVEAAEGAAALASGAQALAAQAAQWSAVAAALLLDSSAGGGGTGTGFSHALFLPALDSALSALAEGLQGPVPFWLAGGLQPSTLPGALQALRACVPVARAWAQVGVLDVSSGVEVEGGAKGVKDPAKVEAFLRCMGE